MNYSYAGGILIALGVIMIIIGAFVYRKHSKMAADAKDEFYSHSYVSMPTRSYCPYSGTLRSRCNCQNCKLRTRCNCQNCNLHSDHYGSSRYMRSTCRCRGPCTCGGIIRFYNDN